MNYEQLLESYLETLATIKKAEEKKDELKLQIMSVYETVSSERYGVKVTKSVSDRVESLKAIEDKSPSLFKALHDAGCIKQVESVRLTVKPL